MNIGGVELVTGRDVQDRWGDVDAERLRDWVRRGLVVPLTVGQLAALAGRTLPPGADPDAPARQVGPYGPENVYRWVDVVEADKITRESARGAHRAA